MSFVKSWVPPALRRAGNRLLGTATTYSGPFETWGDATRATTGYADNDILTRVVAATEAVLARKADYEQDGCAMQGAAPASHALSGLLSTAQAGALRVVDFGGGLASHYLRWLPFLEAFPVVQWCVIEQPHFVHEGRKLFANVPQVRFESSIEDILEMAPHVVLASSVLQYLEYPLDTLRSLAALDPHAIILDRTPFATDARARILVQRTSTTLGRASYPLWMLSAEAVEACLHPRYVHRMTFSAEDHPIESGDLRANYGGSIWWRA